ncbi:MAG: hypothetical protein KA196_06770 [Arenimonas sp.]|nr:hypothetical protein [Arenimonas sp.]
MTLSDWLLLGAALLLLFGLLAWLRAGKGGYRWLLRTLGAGLVLGALLLGGAGLLLRQYLWLLDDVPAATLSLVQLAPQQFRATLVTADEPPREFVLLGDQWQVDARVVRWTLPGRLAGLPPVYRFERISGRYADVDQDRSAERSVHALREGWDFWEFRTRYLADLPIADARWGSAAYLPMADGARFVVYVSPGGGLVAKPADAATEAMVDAAGW